MRERAIRWIASIWIGLCCTKAVASDTTSDYFDIEGLEEGLAEEIKPSSWCKRVKPGHCLLATRALVGGINFTLVTHYMDNIDPDTTPQKDLISKIVFHFVGDISIASKGNWLGASAHMAFCLLTAACAYGSSFHGLVIRERVYYWLSAVVMVASFAASVSNVEVIKIMRQIEGIIPFTPAKTQAFYHDLYTLTSTIVFCQCLLVALDLPFATLMLQDLFGYQWHPDDAQKGVLKKVFFGELARPRIQM